MGKIAIAVVLLLLGLENPEKIGWAKERVSAAPQKGGQIRIPVWVRDATNGFKTGVELQQFQVWNRKETLKVLDLLGPNSPTFLFVALDTVGELANIDLARSALKTEVTRLPANIWVGLISAQEQIQVLQDPTPDRELLQQKIDTYSQIGKAGLLDSIQLLSDFATSILQRTEVRVAIVYITDSDIGNYRQDYLNPPVNYSDSRDLSRRFAGRALQERISRMSHALARYQAPIFIVHIDPRQDPLNREYQNGLKQLAETVGGQLFLSKATNDIPVMIQEVFSWACSFYVLAIQLPERRKEELRLRISLSGEDEGSSFGGRLTYASRYSIEK